MKAGKADKFGKKRKHKDLVEGAGGHDAGEVDEAAAKKKKRMSLYGL